MLKIEPEESPWLLIPTQNQKQPQSTEKKKNPYAAPRSQNLNKQKQDTPAVANFKQQVKNRANSKLDENSQQISKLSEAYTNGSQSKPLLTELRGVVNKDGQLEAQQQQLESQISQIEADRHLAGAGQAPYPQNAQVDAFKAQLQQIKQVRASLLAQYPASGLVKTEEIELGDIDLKFVLTERFQGVQQNIESSKEKINIETFYLDIYWNWWIRTIPKDRDALESALIRLINKGKWKLDFISKYLKMPRLKSLAEKIVLICLSRAAR